MNNTQLISKKSVLCSTKIRKICEKIKEIKSMDLPNRSSLRCHKCRHVLLDDLTGMYKEFPCDLSICNSYNINNFLYIKEENLPTWIKLRIESEQWTKGKLLCENCGYKVGSFDFISGRKCECRGTVIPTVHFVSSQVDRPISVSYLCERNKELNS